MHENIQEIFRWRYSEVLCGHTGSDQQEDCWNENFWNESCSLNQQKKKTEEKGWNKSQETVPSDEENYFANKNEATKIGDPTENFFTEDVERNAEKVVIEADETDTKTTEIERLTNANESENRLAETESEKHDIEDAW